MTDLELIARVLVSDDHDAFGELVRHHQSAVCNFLRHLTAGDAALADDLAQDTFLTALTQLSVPAFGLALGITLLSLWFAFRDRLRMLSRW